MVASPDPELSPTCDAVGAKAVDGRCKFEDEVPTAMMLEILMSYFVILSFLSKTKNQRIILILWILPPFLRNKVLMKSLCAPFKFCHSVLPSSSPRLVLSHPALTQPLL